MKLADIIEVFIAGDWGNESPNEETPNAVYYSLTSRARLRG